jgi:hypothetical protein
MRKLLIAFAILLALCGRAAAAPRRVARFTADGRIDKEWYGGHVWDRLHSDPGHPTACHSALN